MPYLVQRADGRVEIRETQATERGPRSHTLASFRGALSPAVLDRASERAAARLNAHELQLRARELGIPVTERRDEREVRALLNRLRRKPTPDPVLLSILRNSLARFPAPAVPDTLAEVSEWIGAGMRERGDALRGLLRVYDRIVRSRGALNERVAPTFSRFSSDPVDG